MFFVEVGVLDLQKVVHSISDFIVTVKMATAELLNYLVEEVVV